MTWCDSILFGIFPIVFSQERNEEFENDQHEIEELEEKISQLTFSDHASEALAAAERIADAQTQRRRTAETKASAYLAVLAALVPVIISIEGADWEKKTGPAPEWLRLIILVSAIIYTGAAGWFAAKTLKVSGFYTVGVSDIVDAYSNGNADEELAKNNLLSVRKSQYSVNEKVTNIKLSHEHLLRAFCCFLILLVLDPSFVFIKSMNKNHEKDLKNSKNQHVYIKIPPEYYKLNG